MNVRVNGADRETAAGNIGALLDELALPRQTALVEHNGDALRREDWDATPLRDGDKLEILRVAAGG